MQGKLRVLQPEAAAEQRKEGNCEQANQIKQHRLEWLRTCRDHQLRHWTQEHQQWRTFGQDPAERSSSAQNYGIDHYIAAQKKINFAAVPRLQAEHFGFWNEQTPENVPGSEEEESRSWAHPRWRSWHCSKLIATVQQKAGYLRNTLKHYCFARGEGRGTEVRKSYIWRTGSKPEQDYRFLGNVTLSAKKAQGGKPVSQMIAFIH